MFLKNIYKSFDGTEVLRDFTMEIADGEHVALMGKSGKGKTTIWALKHLIAVRRT